MCIYSALAALPAWSETQAETVPAVSIAAPAYWCPYACGAAEPQAGFAVDIARAALESAGFSVEYRNLPYDRALREAREGRVDATLPTFKREAPGFIFPEYAVSLTEYCFYVPDNESWRYSGFESLKDIRFVATSGYSYGPTIDDYIAADLEQSTALIKGDDVPERLRRMVQLRRYDALLDDRLLFESSPSSNGLVNAGCLNEPHPGYLALSPKIPGRSGAIAKAFDRGFERIRADGQICKILEKYGLGPHFVPGVKNDKCPQ